MENRKIQPNQKSSMEIQTAIARMKRDTEMPKQVLYPPVVIAHITKEITDLFVPRMGDKKEIQIHYSAQMNSHPHMGTVLSLMTAFALGQRLYARFDVPVKLKFEVLENAPKEKIEVNGLVYTKMLSDTMVDGVPLSDIYLKSFVRLLEMLKARSGIEYELLTYRQFQEIPFVRRTLLEILSRDEEFRPIIAPSEDYLRLRFPCKECGFAEKEGVTTLVKDKKDDYHLVLESECFKHGKQQIILTPDNKDFIDMNTPLRNVIKEAFFIAEAKDRKSLNVMVDGGDWVAMTDFVVSEGLSRLGITYKDRPVRLFTPIIEDWSGAKFSKSVYVQQGTYNYLPNGFLNLVKFEEEFGVAGLDKLWNEAVSWVSDPRKLFRNYSAEYLLQLLRNP